MTLYTNDNMLMYFLKHRLTVEFVRTKRVHLLHLNRLISVPVFLIYFQCDVLCTSCYLGYFVVVVYFVAIT